MVSIMEPWGASCLYIFRALTKRYNSTFCFVCFLALAIKGVRGEEDLIRGACANQLGRGYNKNVIFSFGINFFSHPHIIS